MRLYITLLDKPNGEHTDSIPLDFCKDCYPEDETDEYIKDVYGDEYKGEHNRTTVDHHTGHPDYNDDPDMYKCEICGKQLGQTEDDD